MERLIKRGRVWYGWFYQDGKRVTRTTKCRDRAAAEAVVRQWERDAADPDHAAARTATLTGALQLLLQVDDEEVLAGRRSPDTVAFHKGKAGHLVRVFETDERGDHVPFHLTRLRAFDVDRYISARRREGAGDQTISKELVVLRKSLRLAIRAGLWRGRVEEVISVAFSPGYEPRKRFLSDDELSRRLLVGADTRSVRPRRLHRRHVRLLARDRARPHRRRLPRPALGPAARHEAQDALPHRPDREPAATLAPRAHAPVRRRRGRGAVPALGERPPGPRRGVPALGDRAGEPERPPPDLRQLVCRRRRAPLPHRAGDGPQGHPDAGAGLRPPVARAARGDDGARDGTAGGGGGGLYQLCSSAPGNGRTRQTRWTAGPSHFRRFGAWGRNRTSDTGIFSPLLYRLSYPGGPHAAATAAGRLFTIGALETQIESAGCSPHPAGRASEGGLAGRFTASAPPSARRARP
jgi:hypothetical protein